MSKGVLGAIAVGIIAIVVIIFFTGSEPAEGLYIANLDNQCLEKEMESYDGSLDTYTVCMTTNADGEITDFTIDVLGEGEELTRKELEEDYGMSNVSELGLEWYEQIANLEKEIVSNQGINGMTALEDGGITLNGDAVSGVSIKSNDTLIVVEELLNDNLK